MKYGFEEVSHLTSLVYGRFRTPVHFFLTLKVIFSTYMLSLSIRCKKWYRDTRMVKCNEWPQEIYNPKRR